MHSLLVGLVVALTPSPKDVLRGVVVDATDQPVADANVTLVWQGRQDSNLPSVQSDERGEFAFDVDTNGSESNHWTIITHKPGWALGGTSGAFNRTNTAPARVKLNRAVHTPLRVVSPDDQPIQGAVVIPEYVEGTNGGVWVRANEELAQKFAVRTDADGMANIEFLAAQSGGRFLVQTEKHGAQSHPVDGNSLPVLLKQQPTGRLSGRVSADAAAAVIGLHVSVFSRPADPQEKAVITGHAEVVTDDDGRFEVPALIAGAVDITVKVNDSLPYRVAGLTKAQLKTGETASIEIPLIRGVVCRGLVVDRATSKPIAGATISVSNQGAFSRTLTTGEDGTYEAVVAPGQLFVNFVRAPAPYMTPVNQFRDEKVSADSPGIVTLQPFALVGGVSLGGIVVDEQDQPVAGARVIASWRKQDDQISTLGSAFAVTGEGGEFVLESVARDMPLGLTATTTSRATPEMVQVHASSDARPKLTVTPRGVVNVSGRVLDESGEPVAGAHVRFTADSRLPTGETYAQYVVSFDNARSVTTDEQGRFRTPSPLPRFTTYAITAEAKGLLAYTTPKLKLDGNDALFTATDIRLTRVRGASGLVVDRDGRPVPGVSVSAPAADPRVAAAATTGDDGRFVLEGIHPEAGFVFLRKPEFRPATAPIAGSADSLRIALARADEARTATPQLTTTRRSASETTELMRKLLLPVYERVNQSTEPNLDYSRRDLLVLMAKHDPEFVRQHLDDVKSARFRVDVLLALGELDDALAVAEAIEDGYSRTYAYFEAADSTTDADRRRDILAQALLHSRTVDDPAHRAVLLGGVAKRLLDAGQRDAARRVLDDGTKIARELAVTQWSGFARGNFAETLAQVDPAAAKELVQELEDSEHARHHGNIAHRLAATNPEAAQEFLRAIRQDRSITPYGVRVCYRMAPVDLPRARDIAANLEQPHHRAHALGVMALAIADKDPDTARELLSEAFDQFTGREAADMFYRRNLFPVAVSLVRISERVDPAATNDYLARAVALHPGPGLPTFAADRARQEHDEQAANLVLLLASYGVYPDEVQSLAEPIFIHAKDLGAASGRNDWYRANAIVMAMALADPERAIAWFHTFYPQITGEDLRLIPQPWMPLAVAIGGDVETLWTHITHEVFHLWVVDREDL